MKLLVLNFILILINPTPRGWFESQYTDALQEVINNKAVINSTLSKCNVSASEAIAVVFPEMLRYSLWKNFLETSALELLYVQKGSKSANFSIGWFQMKPSFAEKVECHILTDSILRSKYKQLINFNCTVSDTVLVRKKRVARLNLMQWQLWYLSAFIDIEYQIFNLSKLSYNERLLILAAAYNKGLDKTRNELMAFSSIKTFPYGPGRDNPFGYAELSIYFYKNDSKLVLNPN